MEYTREEISDAIKNKSSFVLKRRLPAGWYMLEVQIQSPVIRATGHVHLEKVAKRDDVKPLPFTLYSGRMCKRLLYLDIDGTFEFDLLLSKDAYELEHFRLARLTRRFAYSRMLKKLQNLHPRYKLNLASRHYSGQDDFLIAANLLSLWGDYCELFEETSEIASYAKWVREFDTLNEPARVAMRGQIDQFANKPLISVVMPVYNPHPLWLEGAISSVLRQIYPRWQLCIADDASTDPAVRHMLKRYAQADPRIKVIFRKQNGHISAASNSALSLAHGEWVALLDHDDVLPENALFWVVDTINKHPECSLIYSDEDKIDEAGQRSDPYFKCDWNVDLFYSQNMFSHLGVYRIDLIRKVGGFRTGLEGSQDYDLALRCLEQVASTQVKHVARVLYHWRIHAASTAYSSEAKPYAMIAGERAINDHLNRIGVNAKAEAVGYGIVCVIPCLRSYRWLV